MIIDFEAAVREAREHEGHDILLSTYGDPAVNVAFECGDCGAVLHDWTDPRVTAEAKDMAQAYNSFVRLGGHPTVWDMLGLKEEDNVASTNRNISPPWEGNPKPVAQAGGSKQAWDARQNLMDAARLIESACGWAEQDEAVHARLANFEWQAVTGSLEETATELRSAAEFIVATEFEQWQVEAHPCGYSVYVGDRDVCFHEGCWEESETITAAIFLQDECEELLGNFMVENDRYDVGYGDLAKSLNEWVSWWNTYTSGNRSNLTEEEQARVSSVVDIGGKFEDFVTRELFFIGESDSYPKTPQENPDCDCLCHGPNAGLRGHHHSGCACRKGE